MTTPKISEKPAKPADKTPPKNRAVVKPEPKPEPTETTWKGGIDKFDERV